MSIDEKHVEQAYARLRAAINLAMHLDLHDLEALIERMRVTLMLERLDRDRRHVYRALIDLYEAELERRYDASEHDRATVRRQVLAYFRRMLDELSQGEDEHKA